jgi:hypothetical protein
MPVVRFADNLTLMAQDGSDAIIYTDPYQLGGMNYGDVMQNIEVLDGTGGTPTVDLEAESSNDGQNFIALSALSLLGGTAVGVAEAHGAAHIAYIRFKITLKIVGGSAGNQAWTTLDIHVNFTHS